MATTLASQYGHNKGIFGNFESQEAEDAYNFFLTSLNTGSTTQSLQLAAADFLAIPANATAFPISAATMVNKQAVAEYFSITKAQSSNSLTDLKAVLANVTNDAATVTTEMAAIDAASTVSGSNIALTDGKDTLTGTSADDIFLAHVAQNTAQDGSIANALSTGDYIDGGAGIDELSATIINDNQSQGTSAADTVNEINAITKNVEMVRLQVLDENTFVDAGAMDGVKEFWSDNSENALVIDDVRLGTGNAVTKDITFGIKDADASHAFTALLESQAFTNSGAIVSDSQITIEVAYEALPTGLDPITEVTKGLFLQVNFDGTKADGTTGTFASGFLSTDGTAFPHTYEGLKDLIDATLDAQGFTNLSITSTETLNSITTNAGVKSVVANAFKILITDPAGGSFTNQSSGTGQTATAGVSSSDVAANIYTEAPTTATTLIETNLVLDNAGRGSTMGNVTIAGESNSDLAPEVVNIMVDRSSAISTLSTNDTTLATAADNELQKVVITSAMTTLKDTTSANGDLEIGSIVSWDTAAGITTSIDASAFLGTNLMLGSTNEIAGTAIANLDILNATTAANVSFMSAINDDSDDTRSYTTGSGNDTIINTTTYTNTNGYLNSKTHDNLSIDTGAGDDTVTTTGSGDFTITTGTGNDTVYTNNDGLGTASATVNEVQTMTFGAAGDLGTQGQVTVTLGSGQTATTGVNAAAIVTGDTAAIVAGKVQAEIAATAAAAAAAVATVVGNVVTLSYTNAAAAAGSEDIPMATASSLLTDTTAGVAVTTAHVAGTASVAAVAAVVTLTTTTAGAAGDTITFNDGSAVLTLVDTDLNGDVSAFEISEQLAAHTYTLYNVTASNPSLGTVTLTAKTAGVIAALTVVDSGASDATPAITTAGAAATAFVAGTAEVQTVSFTNGADQAGTITLNIDIDSSGVLDADEAFVITIAQGNEADIAAQVATYVNALAGVSAVQGAVAPNLDDVIITWDAHTDAAGTAVLNPATTTMVDGAVRSVVVAETVKGEEASTGVAATWVVNAANVDIANLDDNTTPATAKAILSGATVTVTLSGATYAQSGEVQAAAAALVNGFESTVTIGNTGYLANQMEINAAIMSAVNDSATLNKLLVATQGLNDVVVITSKIDGEVVASDLEITLTAPTATLTAGELSELNAANQALLNDSSVTLTSAQMLTLISTNLTALDTASTYTTEVLAQTGGVDMAGNNSVTQSDNKIDLGAGNDVVVLGTDVNSNDTVVFTGSDIGSNVVVNFVSTNSVGSGAAGNLQATTAVDMLDFTSYLNDKVYAAGSTSAASQSVINNTLSADVDLSANEVAVNNSFAAVGTETWAALTGSNLLTAIKATNTGTADYGNITAASLTVATPAANMVSTTQSNIYMVENDLNAGEYKVFELTSTTSTTDEFTGATLLGTVDFGSEVTFATADIA